MASTLETTLEDILDKLRASASDTRDQGDKFERMMVRFFQTDVEWAQRFDDVWLWMDWPDRPASRRPRDRPGRAGPGDR